MRTKVDIYIFITITCDASAGGLFVLDGIIRPVVTVSALIWFIRFFFNLQLLNNVSSPLPGIGDLRRFRLSSEALWFTCS
jgi:hypothetical protein